MTTAFQSNAFQNNAFQISGGPVPPVVIDQADALELYRRLKKRAKQPRTIDEEKERKEALRKTIENVVSGRDVPATVAARVETAREDGTASVVEFGLIASELLSLNLKMQAAQRALLEAAAEEWMRQDEEDIEFLMENL